MILRNDSEACLFQFEYAIKKFFEEIAFEEDMTETTNTWW